MQQTYVEIATNRRRALGAGGAALLILAGCRGTGQAAPTGGSLLLAPSAAATSAPPQTRFVAGGLEVAAPGGAIAVAPSASAPPAPAATVAAPPVPSAAPSAWSGGMFAATVPSAWRRRVDGDTQVLLALEGPAAQARLVVKAVPADGVSDQDRLAQAKIEAGAGIVAFNGAVIDELRGFYVFSNRFTLDGPRYFRVYGFTYRHHYVSLTASWDKLDPAAADVQRDVDALIKNWKWL